MSFKSSKLPPQIELPQHISVLGTGDYGRAFGKKLMQAGYKVFFGSRHPSRRNLSQIDEELIDAEVMNISDAIHSSDVIILAIPHEVHAKTLKPFEASLNGRIIVDVSNATKISKETSNAEQLALLLPGINIVKAFNTISAYALESGIINGSSEVQICGNDSTSRALIMQLAREMGFTAKDRGGLQVAREVEASTLTLFRGWGVPWAISLSIFVLWGAYGFFRYHYYKPNPYDLHRAPLNVLNKVFACAALTILALIFMPGCLAAFAQLINGTKYKRFPSWLDKWLKIRKQLGLICLLWAAMHCIMSLALHNPAYYSKFYKIPTLTIEANMTKDATIPVASRMKWNGELIITMGVFALASMALLGITSLPSVGALLNWREWNFVQSGLGYACLVTGTVHVMLKGAPYWSSKPFLSTVQGMSFISLWLPWLVMFLKLLVSLPGISCYLNKIRRGYERGPCCGGSNQMEEGNQPASPALSNTSRFTFDKTGMSRDNPVFQMDIVSSKTQTL